VPKWHLWQIGRPGFLNVGVAVAVQMYAGVGTEGTGLGNPETEDDEARENIALFVAEAVLTKPAHTFSLLQALLMAASAGGFSNLVDADFILDKRVVGGLQQVPLRLAEKLGPGSVRLATPVRTIEWDESGATVRGEGVEVRARHVVVAVPPNLYDCIRYVPALPRLRQQLQQHQSLGR
jgi:putrescine oxidase